MNNFPRTALLIPAFFLAAFISSLYDEAKFPDSNLILISIASLREAVFARNIQDRHKIFAIRNRTHKDIYGYRRRGAL